MKPKDIFSSQEFLINAKDNSLKIQSLSYEDSGLYECLAINSVEPSISANFTITIRGRFLYAEMHVFFYKLM